MTVEMPQALERELNDAKAIDDTDRRHEAIEMVQSHMLAALVDCQLKTAERVKALSADAEAKRNRIVGAKTLWAVLRYLAEVCGTGVVVKALCAAG